MMCWVVTSRVGWEQQDRKGIDSLYNFRKSQREKEFNYADMQEKRRKNLIDKILSDSQWVWADK